MVKLIKTTQDELLSLRDELSKEGNPKKRKKLMDRINELSKFSTQEFEQL